MRIAYVYLLEAVMACRCKAPAGMALREGSMVPIYFASGESDDKINEVSQNAS